MAISSRPYPLDQSRVSAITPRPCMYLTSSECTEPKAHPVPMNIKMRVTSTLPQGLSSARPQLFAPVEEEAEIVLQPLIAGIELDRLLAPLHGPIHHIEMPAGDGAKIEQPESPG